MQNSFVPSYAAAKAEFFMELKEKGIVDAQAVLDNMDLEDVEKIIERTSQTQIMADELESAAQRLKELQGDLKSRETALFQADRDKKELQVALSLEKQTGKTQTQVARMTTAARSDIEHVLEDLTDELKEAQKINEETRKLNAKMFEALNNKPDNGKKQTKEVKQ